MSEIQAQHSFQIPRISKGSHTLLTDLQQLSIKLNPQHLIGQQLNRTLSEQDNSLTINKYQSQLSLSVQNKSTQQDEKQDQQNQQQKQKQSKKDDQNISNTKTIIDQYINKQSFNNTSKFNTYYNQIYNQSYGTFINIQQNNYQIIIKCFQLLFQNVYHLFNQRIFNISQTYLTFIKVKYQQQKIYGSVNLGIIHHNKDNTICLNNKIFCDKIKNKLESNKKNHQIYIKNLKSIQNKLQKHFQKYKQSLKQQYNQIKQLNSQLYQISSQIKNLIKPETQKIIKKKLNPQLQQNSFIRTKYLMGRQKQYLSLIQNYLSKILNFISYICLQLQPKNCLMIKESLLNLIEAHTDYRPQIKSKLQAKFKILQKTHCFKQTCKQVSKMLQLCLPQLICTQNRHLINSQKQYNQQFLSKIIQSLIKQSQSLIYIPVIELQSKQYVYHSKNKVKVKWEKYFYNQQHQQQIIQQLSTHLIITNQGHLVLQLLGQDTQQQQQYAILKLKQIKMSRKYNKILINNYKTGIIGYLMSNNIVLGSLTFQSINQNPNSINYLIQQFIFKVKQILENNKNKIGKKIFLS